jgi:putative transposase
VSAVIDLFSRRVVGWSMSASMTAQLVADALLMAVWRRGKPDALMHHSDRGSQYASEQFQRLMADSGIVCSMSRSGNVWDNAAMESFFSSLKTERIERKTYRSRNEARADVFDYIERFYNATRRHSTIGYLSPVEFERKVGLAYPGVQQTGSSSVAASKSGQLRLELNPLHPADHKLSRSDDGLAVTAVTLDELVAANGCSAPSLVKIDVQGAEMLVLMGAEKILAVAQPALFVELDEMGLGRFGSCVSEVLEYLNRFGYRAYWLTSKGGRKCRPCRDSRQGCALRSC